MTSESDVLKTNEFLRRRKLRLQQVREQSKDIAKKIRQRAKVEKLRQTINLDAKKEKEYFDLQEKFVGRLEQLYSRSVENIGSSHRNAAEALGQEKQTNQDISKLRGKEAVAELRKRKQDKLDEQKKILDRKLQAREAANELFRDKHATVAKTLSSKSCDNIQKQLEEPIVTEINNNPVEKDKAERDTSKNDMATQWEADELLKEWGSSVPSLSIPKDDRYSRKHLETEKSEHKRLNLFALSDEMPSSLRGGNSNMPIQACQQQSSVTIVSEYLQTRNLRLREAKPVSTKKSDDLQSIKQTILRSRASKIDGNFSNVCHVLDNQLIPVPSWTAEVDSCLCHHCHNRKPIQPVTNVLINNTNSFQRSASPFSSCAFKNDQRKDNKYMNKKTVSGRNDSSKTNSALNKKPSVTMYNHSTRDTRESYNNEATIVREKNTSDDAYLNALKETSILNEVKSQDLEKKRELLRNKVAVTRENVDKEYKDTLAFLNSLSKEKTSTNNTARMGYDRLQIQNDKRQKHMQDEFRKIEKDCTKKTCKHKNRTNIRHSRSPDSFDRPFQYDWMPVPESDFAVHTLPNKNCVKFNDVDTYHEYRSRHKHTPPTKQKTKDKMNTLVIEDTSETDSSGRTDKDFEGHSDQDRIVIYKILDSKRKRDDKKVKAINRIFKSAKGSDKCMKDVEVQDNTKNTESAFTVKHGEALENLSEGIYKVGENGDNIASTYFENNSNVPTEQQGESKKSVTSQNVENQQVPSTSAKNSTSLRCDHTCPGCKCRHQPLSAPQSSCSFQTAPNDAPEGFVKLIDGQETGKFYIGASGFLKDDNYEVVIQLKKKEIEKKGIEKEEKISKSQEAEDVTKDLTKPDSINSEETKTLSKDTEVQSFAVNVRESAAQTSVDQGVAVDVTQELEQVKSKNVEDKNVNTTFRDSFAIPDDVPKSDPIRPATSTYTQTSFSSPNSRPVFMHMTSSTSTAYMSPPDFIVPQFLRHRVPDVQNERHKQCSHSSRVRRCKHVSGTTDTPPNTARNDDFVNEKIRLCHKNHKHRSVSTLHRGSSKSVHGTHSSKAVPKLRISDNKINPVVKKYVNKLLALNKEGKKAIQVINQDCSSVNTPSSSIVNAPCNMEKDASLDNKISLEQIKIMLEQQIVDEYAKRANKDNRLSDSTHNRSLQKLPKRKQVHKVKSLNISRHLFKNKQINDSHYQLNINSKKSSSTSDRLTQNNGELLAKTKSRNKSSPTNQKPSKSEPTPIENKQPKRQTADSRRRLTPCSSNHTKSDDYTLYRHRTSISTDSDKRDVQTASFSHIPPTDSTHTSGIESEINFIKSAENKLQNMDKIADLTEKCMNRLSNLAKVLEEVRKNKSMVYSHISTSDTASDSEPKQKIPDDRQVCHVTEERNDNLDDLRYQENAQREYIPLLQDIPKPLTPSTLSLSTISEKSNAASSTSDQTKHKARPPPALSRINLKTTPDNFVVPHELSTVMEVDSPMSVKLKNQSSRQNLYREPAREPTVSGNPVSDDTQLEQNKINQANSPKTRSKTPSLTSDDTKMEMMDMKIFNDIMLKPFVSLQEYAKQCSVPIEDASNMEDLPKNEQGGGEMSSLHSDGSLPDVISELLKRKLISEPFKFDTATASHLTTSVSSESSLSLLALSNIYKAKRRSSKHVANKENLTETSETLSLSSNPDLENAFQKLGMGWASSTLKKTKERLALSSSSNTSSSSYSQLKFKSFNKDPPALATDSSLSDTNRSKNVSDSAKNAVQQTSVTNSMIVKEFLKNELAKKITFTNQSSRNADEFVSLYETQMPEEIRDTPEKTREADQSVASQTNRARTSTPVQIFKSTTYHTTSSSNNSNGLFSNAEELSSVKVTSTSIRNHSTSDRDDLTIPNCSLKRKGSDNSKSA
ncbi:uncharacterized protein LOC123717660 isoform X2 [Pieris brassicae]|uniref:uncharacterized protein LOC123717660 isoform X2 n=1 Tax=Pieris brassicae TaxID=7116 RepID=UPI001E65E272|nr:uncharacterized protein LOC123717660 isoform X2 [Pieris brassicae]